ncbi:phosphoglucomutase [Treponema medium]|uniref:Alpha-D-phosphohexomutase alpha/beta/alpha domain-containing protein n=2 Tax=Treponema medium TaxID=58231 RepID=A0AA87TH41_TREMD|nr:hypothetical protein [Treponema medium]EPF29589.1 hypothetical protein HMPREF9195_00290 [Treponema medium ATCC 700293]QSH96449.1 phosphoglucomutase [Treponema medium]
MNTAYPELQQAFEKMILSASGWRKVFAQSGNENDGTPEISAADCDIVFLAAQSFAEFLHAEFPAIRTVIVARDSRPTGAALLKEAVTALAASAAAGSTAITVQSAGITAAPEIMAYARTIGAAFMYISASHNPIGHNGFKFGLDSGGVLDGNQSARLIALFTQKCKAAHPDAVNLLRKDADPAQLRTVFESEAAHKQAALTAYKNFLREVIADSQDTTEQARFFASLKQQCAALAEAGKPFTLVADFNGSARAASVDRIFFEQLDMQLTGIAEKAGTIVHGIIPEGGNLATCAAKIEELHRSNPAQAENTLFGYMPDCDGDRGNIIYWDEVQQKALILEAQEVFALSVIAELSYLHYSGNISAPLAVTVNGPTSLRINEIAKALEAEVFYAEVGEANVVNRAEDARRYGYKVRILGEGSNGGNITYPAAVRDPLNTLFAISKLLLIKDTPDRSCPFRIWCERSGQTAKYRKDFTFADIIATLPRYWTTPTQEARALMHIHTTDHTALKSAYQKIFMQEWADKKQLLKDRFGIVACKVFAYNGTVCSENLRDFAVSAKGGLKVQFYNASHTPIAFIWMRGSGTEPVFRIMADIKGYDQAVEEYLVQWQGDMVRKADAVVSAKN